MFLVQTYKTHRSKARTLWDNTSKHETKELPKSKMDTGISMCIAWYTKGHCNMGCPLAFFML